MPSKYNQEIRPDSTEIFYLNTLDNEVDTEANIFLPAVIYETVDKAVKKNNEDFSIALYHLSDRYRKVRITDFLITDFLGKVGYATKNQIYRFVTAYYKLNGQSLKESASKDNMSEEKLLKYPRQKKLVESPKIRVSSNLNKDTDRYLRFFKLTKKGQLLLQTMDSSRLKFRDYKDIGDKNSTGIFHDLLITVVFISKFEQGDFVLDLKRGAGNKKRTGQRKCRIGSIKQIRRTF